MVRRIMLTFCVILPLLEASQYTNNGNTTMDNQLQQLEETVSDLQKHMLAKEQEQRAVLSSVLSKLILTTDKLTKLQHNYTNELTKLQHNYTDELSKQKRFYTDQLAKLQHDYKLLENKFSILKESYTSVDKSALYGQGVAFQAAMAKNAEPGHNIQFQANSTLKFPATQYNEGGCWNPSSSVFTASVNGTYLFWINLSFTGVKTYTVSMKKNDQDMSKAFGYLNIPKEMSSHISLTSVTQLVNGDRVYFVAHKLAKYWPNVSSCGGVLLHSSAAH